ncbi:MAG: hypothetical protein AB7P33_00285 [Dehalococcoidia bacterium]
MACEKRTHEIGRRGLLFAIKAIHSAAFFVIQTAIVYLLYKGLRRESDAHAAAAAAIACGESAIYAANGFRCPLTAIAEDLGDKHGQVTDIFLPKWLADNIANIYTPVLVVSLLLHVRNLRDRRRSSSNKAAALDL